MPAKIFISYRRDDVAGDARGIRDALAAKFGRTYVFMDVDDLLAGQRFDVELAKALDTCDVLIAVIGPRWMDLLKARTASGERDYVRAEIAAALTRGIVVIPVRVGQEGRMPLLPREAELPDDIRDLVLYQKHDVAHERFGRDVADLIAAIQSARRNERSPLPWGKIAAAVVVVVLAAVVFLYLYRPQQTDAVAKVERETREKEIAKAEARRKTNEERQRIAKAAEDQRAAEAKRKTEEAEQDRVAKAAKDKRKAEEPAVPLAGQARAQETIKVGILHSLSGTLAISETTLKDVMLMLIEDQNKKGGLLGKKLEAVVVDPASNWPLFAEKARELIAKHKVAAVFGCGTSVSRKSVLPVFKELNSVLFYPVQYEGEESERNVFYTGAAPNQQAIPAVDYLEKEEKVVRWVLAGTDYVYPRTTNKILDAYLKAKGVKAEDIMINYTPFGHSDWQTIVAEIKRFGSQGKRTAIVSTINGDANVSFYKELANQGIKAKDIPSVAFSVGEEELAGIDTKPLVGHMAAWNYFQSVDTPINKGFISRWKTFIKDNKRVTNDPMEAHVIGFAMWVEAVKKAGTTDSDKVIDAIVGIKVPNLTGGMSEMLPNHHITKPVLIGEVRADGQFDVVWKTPGLVPGDAWSKQLEGSRDLIADWVKLKCGNYNTRTNRCGS